MGKELLEGEIQQSEYNKNTEKDKIGVKATHSSDVDCILAGNCGENQGSYAYPKPYLPVVGEVSVFHSGFNYCKNFISFYNEHNPDDVHRKNKVPLQINGMALNINLWRL